MEIRVGVVGPEDSVMQVMKVGKHYKELNLIPYVYEKTEETEEIIIRNKEWIDQWFFSGQAPYYFALSKGIITEEEASYTLLNGSSLLGTLLEAFLKEGRILKNLSLDTIEVDEVNTPRHPLYNKGITIHTHSYSGYLPSEEIIQFHKNLYKKGHIDVAITCIKSVYDELLKIGIPVYRVVQSELAIQRTLEHVKEKGQVNWYRKSQLVVIGVEVIRPASSFEEHHISFKVKHQELELNRVLLQFTEEINGSIVQIGDGLHFIYTTKGELDLFKKNHTVRSISDEIYVNSTLHVRIGIGYGLTVLDAEHNVRIAFEHARQHKESVVITINEEKEVKVNHEDDRNVSYQTRNLGKQWEELFKDANINSTIVSKIESLSNHYKQNAITSQELSRWLKGTERNARRILAEMERIGMARVSGEESGQRGRPRKIYDFQFEKLGK
ncbi:hypothetical protein M1D47_09910 [Bacillus sp. R1-10]